MATKRMRISWGTKLLLLLLAFSTIPAFAVSYFVFHQIERTSQESTLERLQGLALAKAQTIDQFMSHRVRQVERIATLVVSDLEAMIAAEAEKAPEPTPLPPEPLETAPEPAIPPPDPGSVDTGGAPLTPPPAPTPPVEADPNTMPEGPETPKGEAELDEDRPPPQTPATKARKSVRKTLAFIQWDRKDYEELLLIRTDGVVLVSTFDAHEGKTAAGIEYFRDGLRATKVQNVFVSPITEQLSMVVATPVRDDAQRVIGVLAARLNLESFFKLVADHTGLGLTGETVLARKAKDEIIFMAPTRHDDEAALKRKVPVGAETSIPLQEATRGQSGSGTAIDYRGAEVFGAWQHIPSLNWGLEVKIDRAEAEKAIVSVQNFTAMLLLGILALVLLISTLVSRALVAPLRELQEATEQISKGDLDVKLRIRSGDEVGELADSFERMVAAIKFFREDKLEDDDSDVT